MLVGLCGCGTVANNAFFIPFSPIPMHSPYGGVRRDISWIKEDTDPKDVGLMVFRVVDVPFSAVADTLLLPINLVQDKPARIEETPDNNFASPSPVPPSLGNPQ
jgi:uncharacterized protein YceK